MAAVKVWKLSVTPRLNYEGEKRGSYWCYGGERHAELNPCANCGATPTVFCLYTEERPRRDAPLCAECVELANVILLAHLVNAS